MRRRAAVLSAALNAPQNSFLLTQLKKQFNYVKGKL